MSERQAATPEDAKAVWEAIEAKGGKPSLAQVAAALNACGKYHTVYKGTVGRWKKAGWQRVEKKAMLKPAAVQAEQRLDEAAPVITRDPTSTMADLRDAIDSIVGEGEIARLLRSAGEDLYSELERENFVTMIVAERVARAQMPDTPVKDIGAFTRGVAQSLLATATSAKVRQAIALPPPEPGDNAKVIDHDDLDPAWDTYRKAVAAA